MFSSFYLFGICSIVLTGTVEANYNVFTYNDGTGNDEEHCCLVQLNDKFCLAQPLTRSLIQVDRDCQQLNANDKTKDDLKKVIRRLTVASSEKVGQQILIELSKPLEKEILKDDLLCLTTANNNNINLEKCHIIFANIEAKKSKRKEKNTTNEEPAVEQVEIRRVDLAEAIQIYQGQGVAVRQTFQLDLNDVKPTTRQEREYWSWYRTNTKKICNQPQKIKKICKPFSRENEKYLRQILNSTTDDNEEFTPPISVTKGSTLFCENNQQQTRLLGYYQDSEICFQTINQVYIEHQFNDFVSLSNAKSNQRVLQYIANSSQLTNEYERDCNDKTTLADIKKALKQEADAKAAAKAEAAAKAKAKAEAKAAAKAAAEEKAKAKATAKAEKKTKETTVVKDDAEAESVTKSDAKVVEQVADV